jgi:cytochrome c-type biogenesis protein CcmH/NrfG
MDPGNVVYWYNLGEVYFRVKNYEKARNAWIRTLQLKPDYAEAQRGMAALPNK